ncbi:hypothetical protein ACFC05_39200, partial [Streptomyces hydrogenans]
MPHRTDAADRRGLILDFAGVLTASPIDVHRAWCVSEGLVPGASAGSYTTTSNYDEIYQLTS